MAKVESLDKLDNAVLATKLDDIRQKIAILSEQRNAIEDILNTRSLDEQLAARHAEFLASLSPAQRAKLASN